MKYRIYLILQFFFVLISCSPNLRFEDNSHRPVAVETFHLQSAVLPRKKAFSGSTLPWEMVVLSFKTSGRLIDAPFEEGDHVKKGQIVGKLDPVDQYMAHVVAREKLRSLETDVVRVEKLTRQGALPEAERERILGYRDALATQMAQASIQMEATILRAPLEGIIGRKMAYPGEMMDPTRPLGVLLVLHPIKVQIAVKDADLPLFSKETAIRVKIDTHVWEGKVHQVSTIADENTRAFTVTIAVPNPPDTATPIRVGQLATVEVDETPRSGFFVPAKALEIGTAQHARMLGVVNGKLAVFDVQVHEQEGPFIRITGDFPTPLDVILGGFSLPAGQSVESKVEWTLETWSEK